MRKIIENLIVFIATIVVLFLLATILLPKFGYGLIVIKSGSMEPIIKTGSVLVSKKQTTYQKGDIITFRKNGNEIVTHRVSEVIKKNDRFFYKTKGDANNTEDLSLIKNKDVLGKNILIFPYLGYGIGFLKSRIGVIILILLPAGYFVWKEILKIKEEVKKIRQKQNNI